MWRNWPGRLATCMIFLIFTSGIELGISNKFYGLVEQGYRVLVVEQTETPEQLELRRKEKGSKDKVQFYFTVT